MKASFRGQKFAAEILIDFGADVENINKSKQTALHFGILEDSLIEI